MWPLNSGRWSRRVRMLRGRPSVVLLSLLCFTLLLMLNQSERSEDLQPSPLISSQFHIIESAEANANGKADRSWNIPSNSSPKIDVVVKNMVEGYRRLEVSTGTPSSIESPIASHSQVLFKDKMKLLGNFIPVAEKSPSDHLRPVTENDVKKTLEILDKKIQEGKKALSAVADLKTYWNLNYPTQLLIITSWRSGSTFFSEILSHHPAVYHHYEPLIYLGPRQVRNGDLAVSAVEHLRTLLHCNFSNSAYVRVIKRNPKGIIGPSIHTWNACLEGPNVNVCKDPVYLRQACERFPLVLSKIVRLRLILAQGLLDDPELDRLKIVYLVRDPRATYNSRIGVSEWCGKSKECMDPAVMCNDIQADLDAMEMLSASYPGRLALIKYETLAQNPQKTFEDIFKFAEMPILPSVTEEIRKHTSHDEGNVWATYRKSADRINMWQTQLSRENITFIQNYCSSVLMRLGYSFVNQEKL